MHLLPSRVSVQQLHRASAAADVALRSFDPMPLEPAVSVDAAIEGPSATLMAAVVMARRGARVIAVSRCPKAATGEQGGDRLARR